MTVLNGAIRLLWTYLYRCHEPASTVTMKLESLMKAFFPANRLSIVPQEDRIDSFVYMVHFILTRHPDYGSELCSELLQERVLNALSSTTVHQLGPERFAIAVQAILLSVHLAEKEESTPTWPSGADFSRQPVATDYPISADVLLAPVTRQVLADLLDRCSKCVCAVATTCYQSVGNMSVFDEQWLSSHLSPPYEDSHNYIIRKHSEGTYAYPQSLSPHIFVLQTCFQAWPRCLHSSISLDTVVDMLLRGVMHVELLVCDVAATSLKRFMKDSKHANAVLSRFYVYLFDPQKISSEGSGLRLAVECAKLVNLWINLLDQWIEGILQTPRQDLLSPDVTAIASRIDEVEAGSLFLLSHSSRVIQRCGVTALRKLSELLAHVCPASDPVQGQQIFQITDAMLGGVPLESYLGGSEDMLDPGEVERLKHWRASDKDDTLLLIAESEEPVDRSLWKHVFAVFVQICMEHKPATLLIYRDMLKAAATRYHPYILYLSGVKPSPAISGKQAPSGDKSAESRIAAHQWYIWLRVLSATAQVPESRPVGGHSSRDHSRARSEAHSDRTDLVSSRDMFKYLSQFLDSDHSAIRDAAVFCISSLPAYGYSHLLDDLSVLAARQIFDDPRVKSPATTTPLVVGRARRQERFQTALARIYFLTAHLILEQRSSGKQAALAHVLKYVRNMQATLGAPDTRDAFSMQRLRRYFCGTVERLFDGLATLNDSDRFIPAGMHLALYRMCEEWCQLGKQADHVKKRLVVMQTAAAKSYQDPAGQAELIQRFQTETRALSHAAVGAMASLVVRSLSYLTLYALLTNNEAKGILPSGRHSFSSREIGV